MNKAVKKEEKKEEKKKRKEAKQKENKQVRGKSRERGTRQGREQSISHTDNATLLASNNDGLEELVLLVLFVARLDGGNGIHALLALAEDHALEGNLVSLPPLVAVHGVVATDDGGNVTKANLARRGNQLLKVGGTRLGVRVAAVAKGVDVDLGDSDLLGGPEEGIQVGLLRVLDLQLVPVGHIRGGSWATRKAADPSKYCSTHHAAVRHQTTEVKLSLALGHLQRLLDGGVLAKLALLDGLVDADNVLPHDTTGADVQVADLGVSHEAFGQADGERRGLELGEARLAQRELVHDRGLGGGNGIAILGGLLRGNAPAVNHDCRTV
jgi:hypothetical protein